MNKQESQNLMIGSWVLAGGEPRQVRSITKKKVGVLTSNESHRQSYYRLFEVEPIPITEEWLMKNGFEKIGDKDSYGIEVYNKELPDITIEIRKNGSNTIGRDWFCHIDNQDCQGIACADVQYIHQLQNLLNLLNIKMEMKVEL